MHTHTAVTQAFIFVYVDLVGAPYRHVNVPSFHSSSSHRKLTFIEMIARVLCMLGLHLNVKIIRMQNTLAVCDRIICWSVGRIHAKAKAKKEENK